MRTGLSDAPEFVALTSHSLATIARLEKFRGHLYNWYDTETLSRWARPLFLRSTAETCGVALHAARGRARTVQTAAASTAACSRACARIGSMLRAAESLPRSAGAASLPGPALPSPTGSRGCLKPPRALLQRIDSRSLAQRITPWWLTETRAASRQCCALLRDYLPWMLPEFAPLRETLQLDCESSRSER